MAKANLFCIFHIALMYHALYFPLCTFTLHSPSSTFLVTDRTRKKPLIIKQFSNGFICIKWVPGDPNTIFLATSFTQKLQESSDSMYFSIIMLKGIWYHYFPCNGPILQETVDLLEFWGRGVRGGGFRGPTIGKKLRISCEFGPLLVKW